MLFNLYGENAGYQLLGWLLVFVGLIVMNEIGRRTKFGGILLFVALPLFRISRRHRFGDHRAEVVYHLYAHIRVL